MADTTPEQVIEQINNELDTVRTDYFLDWFENKACNTEFSIDTSSYHIWQSWMQLCQVLQVIFICLKRFAVVIYSQRELFLDKSNLASLTC